MHDPIVEEVRQARDEHARRFGYDLDAICADLMARQLRSGHVLVNRKDRPRPVGQIPAGHQSPRPAAS